MSRTRAERRANTHAKTSKRKALAIRGEADVFPAHGYCGGKVTPGGEARNCTLCDQCAHYERAARATWEKRQLSAFMKSFEEWALAP